MQEGPAVQEGITLQEEDGGDFGELLINKTLETIHSKWHFGYISIAMFNSKIPKDINQAVD